MKSPSFQFTNVRGHLDEYRDRFYLMKINSVNTLNLVNVSYFCRNLFEHGDFQKINWLLLVIVFCFVSGRGCRVVHYSTNHYSHTPIYLHFFCKGDEHHVNPVGNEQKMPLLRHLLCKQIVRIT